MKQEYVYEFLYNPSTYESAAQTVSIHKTRRGAEKAMELHKEKAIGYLMKKTSRLGMTNGGVLESPY
jgi:hypothetical protein